MREVCFDKSDANETELYSNVIELLQRRADEYKAHLVAISPPKEQYNSREINELVDQMTTISDQCERAYNEMISSTMDQQEYARASNQVRIKLVDIESSLDDACTEKKSVDDKHGINQRKIKHLLIIRKHLQKGMQGIISELESIASQIVESFSSSTSESKASSLLSEFDKLITSLEFRIQFLHKAEDSIDPEVLSRIVRLERVNAELTKKYPRTKDIKLERYYQYIGESLNKEESGDAQTLLNHIDKLIEELQTRNAELAQHSRNCQDQMNRLENEQRNETQREIDLRGVLARAELDFARIHTTLQLLSERRNETLRRLLTLLSRT
jgi:chromosome segregation ATPase